MAPDSQGCFAALRYVCTSTIGAEKRLFTIHNKRAFDGCLCWCPVAPMCLDPMQHSHILDNSYLVIEFHNWCGDAPMHGAQQVQLLMGCLCWPCIALMTFREKAKHISHLVQKSLPSDRGVLVFCSCCEFAGALRHPTWLCAATQSRTFVYGSRFAELLCYSSICMYIYNWC